jgi:NitT/TauT family transport system substrate-binding protein
VLDVRHALGLLLLVATAGCQTAGPPPAPTAAVAAPVNAAPANARAGAAVPTTALPPRLNPPQPVRVGVLGTLGNAGIYIGLERGYYHDLGLELEIETIADPNTIGTLVNTNQLDVAGFGVNANPFLAAARGLGIKIVADQGQLRPGVGQLGVLVRKDLVDTGQFRSFADLRGRTIARLSRCESTDPQIERVLERRGLTRDDIETAYLGFPETNVALANGAVDLTWQVEPLQTLAIERDIAVRFAGADEIYPYQQIAALYYSGDFAAHTEAARRFMIGYIHAVRDYNDAFYKGGPRGEIAQILAKHTAVKDLSLYDRMYAAGLDPDGHLNVQGIRDDVALFARLGCITGEVADVSQVVDESFVQYAVGILGPYAR